VTGLRGRRADRWLTLGLALATVSWLLAVEGRQGIGRDESQYMRAGERYWGWFEDLAANLEQGKPGRSFAPSSIDRYWSDNAPDHPVIMKTLRAATLGIDAAKIQIGDVPRCAVKPFLEQN